MNSDKVTLTTQKLKSSSPDLGITLKTYPETKHSVGNRGLVHEADEAAVSQAVGSQVHNKLQASSGEAPSPIDTITRVKSTLAQLSYNSKEPTHHTK